MQEHTYANRLAKTTCREKFKQDILYCYFEGEQNVGFVFSSSVHNLNFHIVMRVLE